MSEWANFRSYNSSSGWSARGGQCRNPHDLTRNPCGSSSGSAAAVAAGLVPVALGTETLGSIICPSAICGIVGLKPTYGLVSNEGVIPGAHSTDCVGPMARSVSEVARAMNAIAESDQDYTSGLKRGALKGRRLGLYRESLGFDRRVDRIVEEQLEVLKSLGAELVGDVNPADWEEMAEEFRVVSLYEFHHGVDDYLSCYAPEARVRSLAGVAEFNREHPEKEAMSYLGQGMLLDALETGTLNDPAYLSALESLRRKSDLEKVLRDNELDAIVGPSNGPAWKIDFVNGDHFEGGNSVPAAIAGCPHVTVPAGFIHGLPIGLSLYGPKNSEVALLGMAYDLEQETQAFRAPKI